ncbi:hypothetical protein [Pseudovibrio sp. FO-BEG1]|uniref:hypothetical protein n=1 Tax=Pseudovibrio sp. (strain FO-BEG1) TaxID=911045 RepID=UPI0009FF5D17|nr:hypothetical protein [Pseudovibrio sp. FO-BEG1]
MSPPLLKLSDESEYRSHYESSLCQGEITTHDGIRVYFKKNRFEHAFFESSNRNGQKDSFSLIRAERMDWITATLQDPNADWYQGYDSKSGKYNPKRRVAIAYGDFVVIISISMKRNGSPKANFITCYNADNSISKIRTSPRWTAASLGIVTT